MLSILKWILSVADIYTLNKKKQQPKFDYMRLVLIIKN